MNMFEKIDTMENTLKANGYSYQKEVRYDGHHYDFLIDNGDNTYWTISYKNPANEKFTLNNK